MACSGEDGLFRLFWSDVRRAYPEGSASRAVVRGMINSSLHACALIRLIQSSPSWLHWFWRRLLISLHGMDVSRGVRIGRGLSLPHPVSIVIGGGVVIGSNVTIFQGVTVGTVNGRYPVIEDGVTIYPSAVVVGFVKVESGAQIRGLSFVSGVEELVLLRRKRAD